MNDPDGERQKTLREMAESKIDALWIRDAAKGELARDDKTAANLIALALEISIEDLMSGNVAGAKPQEQRQPSGYFPQREAIAQAGQVRPAQMPTPQERASQPPGKKVIGV